MSVLDFNQTQVKQHTSIMVMSNTRLVIPSHLSINHAQHQSLELLM